MIADCWPHVHFFDERGERSPSSLEVTCRHQFKSLVVVDFQDQNYRNKSVPIHISQDAVLALIPYTGGKCLRHQNLTSGVSHSKRQSSKPYTARP